MSDAFEPFFDNHTDDYADDPAQDRWGAQGFVLSDAYTVYRLIPESDTGNWVSGVYCQQSDGSFGVELWEHKHATTPGGDWAPVTRVATEQEAREMCIVAFVNMRFAGWSRETAH